MSSLTGSEMEELSQCINFTTIQTKGVNGGGSNLPYVFIEQGAYMLMTAISEMEDIDFVTSFNEVIQRYLGDPVLVLR